VTVESENAVCRVVIVDDHTMVREAIALALGRSPQLDVVGSASSVREGRAMVQELHPDVVVLDYSLPDGTGIDLARSIHEADPPARTILLTASEGVQAAAEAVSAGCSGFVRKSADLDDLAAGVLRVHGGEAIFDAQTLSAAIGWLNRPSGAPVGLTERELDVLRCLAEGRSTVEISELLYLSHHTVRNHVRNILGKLGARSQLEAVVIGATKGLVSVGRD
jgi:two-component system, NarL family, nitrate/nitrite response regulator NarL